METKACSGLDVHKDSIYAAVFKHNLYSEVRIFSTLTSDLKVLSQWLLSEGVESIAMESTRIYWVLITCIFSKGIIRKLLSSKYVTYFHSIIENKNETPVHFHTDGDGKGITDTFDVTVIKSCLNIFY